MMDRRKFSKIFIIILQFDTFLKGHIDNAVLKSLKFHNNDNIAGKISLGRLSSLVTFLSKTL